MQNTIKIGRVEHGDLTHLTRIEPTNTIIHTALLKFISHTGVRDDQLIGFGRQIADLMITHLSATPAKAEDLKVVVDALSEDGTTDPFVIYFDGHVGLHTLESVLKMINDFNKVYSDADTADFLFMRDVRRHPVELLSPRHQYDYIAGALNSELGLSTNTVLKQAILNVIETPRAETNADEKLKFFDALIEQIDDKETSLEYDDNREGLRVISDIADDIHTFLVDIGERHPK